jgi:uncharacterized integral membrane protein (TIGR00698 family)
MTLLESHLLGVRVKESPRLLPGLLAAALLAWASAWLSEFLGADVLGFRRSPLSAVTVAILLGLVAGNIARLPAWVQPGLVFAVKRVLRLGIILLGIRLSLFDLLDLGLTGLPIVAMCIGAAMFLTDRLSRWLKLPPRLGTLIAVGTSICGVSAIVATGPAIEARDEEVAYAVAVITVFGIVATLAYPYLAYVIFAGDAVRAGLFLGTAIHDTSQVAGAGLVFSELYRLPRALDVATVTKLVRNVCMAGVVPWMAIRQARRTALRSAPRASDARGAAWRLFPLFVLGFALFAALRTLGDAGIHGIALPGGVSLQGRAFGLWDAFSWKAIHAALTAWATHLLTLALAAVGLTTRFSTLRQLGIKPFVVGLGAAVAVGAVSVAAIAVLGAFFTL